MTPSVDSARQARVLEMFQLDPAIEVVIRKKKYTFELDNTGVKGIYKDTHVNLLARAYTIEDLYNPDNFTSIIYWSLKHHHPDITKDEVDRDIVNVRWMAGIIEILRQVIDLYTPDMSDLELAVAPGPELVVKDEVVDPMLRPTGSG